MTKDPMLAAIVQQVECYRKLAKLAVLQHEHVRSGRTEDLLTVLEERQNLLDQVADLEQTIAPAKKAWNDYLAGLSAGERAEAEAMMTLTRKLLEEITTADRNDAMVLQQRKFSLGREINRAVAARKFNKAYSAAAYGSRAAALDTQT